MTPSQTIALMVFALTSLGCVRALPRPEVVWPDPPEVPRVRFVTAFARTDDLDTSGFAAFRRTILGTGGSEVAVRQPMGLAISEDGKRLYIADHASSAVLLADFEKKSLTQFAPDEPVGKPMGVAIDKDEQVYISDSVGKTVRVFDKTGKRVRQIGTGQLERPTGIAIDDVRRRIYVTDSSRKASENHRVRVFDLDGKWLSDLGAQPGRPGKGPGEGQWHFPSYVTLDREGNIFVSDSMNFRIQVFKPDGTFVRVFGENGDGPGFFSRLKGLAFDGFGNLYAVDGGHANVQMFNKDFAVLMYFGGYSPKLEYFDVPSGIAIDKKSNKIYVCNEFISRINVYELINTREEDSQMAPPPAAPIP